MRIVVIGATGHIGTFLVPRLIGAGHDVVAVSRGHRAPYAADPAWDHVERVTLDRTAAEADGDFGERIAALSPEVVVDLTCFTVDSARMLVDALTGRVAHLVHCGTIWVHGLPRALPILETDPREPFGEYGVAKAAIESYLLGQSADGVPTSVVHPGHISGPGWAPIGPLGNLDAAVWRTLATGSTLHVPGTAQATMNHVHADDVAQVFDRAIATPQAAIGRSFHAVAARAMTVRGYAEAAAAWFGTEADLAEVSWEEFADASSPDDVDASRAHLTRSHVASIRAAEDALGYAPRFTAEETTRLAVAWLVEQGELDTGGVPLVAG